MKTYDVYKHPIKGVRVVKKGFAWGAFLFGWLGLMLWHKLYKKGLIFLFLSMIVGFFVMAIASSRNGEALAFIIGNGYGLISCIFGGLKANAWSRADLEHKGFELLFSGEAKSEKDAIAKTNILLK